MESQEEKDMMESESEGREDEEEEAEQLEEMKPPVLTSWMGPDGVTVTGIMSIDDGVLRLNNRCQFDDCSICYSPATAHGNHYICCLPCGHMYGFSCIKKWLLQSSSSGKCPQCNTLCTIQDARRLYPPPLCATAPHQKASLTAFFPLTRQGFDEFKEYETSRALDAIRLQANDMRHINILVSKHNDLVDRTHELTRQSDSLLTQAEELEERPESLEVADALRSRVSLLKPRIDALGRRTDALKRLVSALRRRSDALGRRKDAFQSRLTFFAQMYKEHRKKRKNNNEPCTVEVPMEELVKYFEVEYEEEKVEEKAKPTTKTTRSRRNKGKGPDSISKVILKRK